MKNQVLSTLLVNDLKKNKVLNITLFLFIFISALLIATGVITIERLNGSLDQIYSIAEPPHYLQLYVGDVDHNEVGEFAKETGLVKSYQIQDMLNIDGASISYERSDGSRGTLSSSLFDNYFVYQNEGFDFLLDMDNQVVSLGQSEIGIPLTYARKHKLDIGDQISINMDGASFNFVVTQKLRDAQMGSSLATSIRFLISEKDHQQLSELALRHESIIGFRLHNESDINAFNELYNSDDSNMPKEGIGITLPLINMMNSIGDGFMSGVMILVGLLMMSIAMLNMRFSIQSTIEEEIREIGTLKAIGIGQKDIKGMYKTKYRFITLVACLLAVVAAFGIVPYFLENVAQNFGLSQQSILTFVSPIVAVGILYITVMLSLNRVLKAVSKLTIIDAITIGKMPSRKKKKRQARLSRKMKNVDHALSLNMYRNDLRSWKTYIVACFLCTLAIFLPINLLSTLSSEKFVSYVGAASSDIRMSVEYRSELEPLIVDMKSDLATSDDIKDWHEFIILQGKVQIEDRWINIPIESGEYDVFSIDMDEGKLPESKYEIALSALNANRLELGIGDTVPINFLGEISEYQVVGIYQDITNGGLTAKISSGYSGKVLQHAFFVNLNEGTDADKVVEKWSETYPKAKVIRVDQLISQMLDSITTTLNVAVVVIVATSILVIGLVSVLFLMLRLHKNKSDNAVLLAIGYRVETLRGIYLAKSLFSCVIGTILGLLCSLLIGESLLSMIFSAMAFGITRLSFIINPLYLITGGMILPILVVYLITHKVTNVLNKTSIMTLGND